MNNGVSNTFIEFSRPMRFEAELANLNAVLESGFVHGDGPFTDYATSKLKSITGASGVLLTTSGTHALEMACRLLDIGPGDEVIIPSFTFSSGAVSIVSTGATPVFVDIEMSSGNIDINQISRAITPKTKAISVMHYGGQPVQFEPLLKIAQKYGLRIIEDNAHGLGVKTELGVLGTIGDVGIQSFHDTKNVHCGEGGAILINDSALMANAEVMREKGTNRSNFLRGQVDKYTWVDWGSSYLLSELNASVLSAQLDGFDEIQESRSLIWHKYRTELSGWAEENSVSLMSPINGRHASHVFYMVFPTDVSRDYALAELRRSGVGATFHYVPLHSSPAGTKFGRSVGDFTNTDNFAARLLRLPLFGSMTQSQVNRVIESVRSIRVT